MLAKRPDLREAMVGRKMRVCVMAQSESTTDLPEQRDWKKPRPDDRRLTADEKQNYERRIGRLTDKEYWDRRAGGWAGTRPPAPRKTCSATRGPATSAKTSSSTSSHTASWTSASGTPSRNSTTRSCAAYEDAMAQGLWKGHYASTNPNEYWAEGTQTWFWSNYEYVDGDRRVQSPDDLEQYDPRLFALLARVYPDHKIPMDVYHGKNLRPGPRRRPRDEPRPDGEERPSPAR